MDKKEVHRDQFGRYLYEHKTYTKDGRHSGTTYEYLPYPLVGFDNDDEGYFGLGKVLASLNKYNKENCDYKCKYCPECGEKLNLKKDEEL